MTTPTPVQPPANGVIVTQPPAANWRYGLYSAATLLPFDDGHWQVGGVTWSPDTCTAGGTWPGGSCVPDMIPPTWAMAQTPGTGPQPVITQADATNKPFEVTLTYPPKGTGKTVTRTSITWGESGQPPEIIDGDVDNANLPQVGHTYPLGRATAYTLRFVYTYADATTDTGTITLTWTGGGPSQRAKDTSGIDWEWATPFVVYNAIECLAVGFPDASDRANARLTWNEPRLVERAFWTGVEGNFPALATGTTCPVVDVTQPGTDIATALGLLEFWGQNEIGAQLIIHAPRILAPIAAAQRLVIADGSVLRTPLGSVWAFGAGYDLTGPDGQITANTAWMYATGPVTVRRSNQITNEVFNQYKNLRLAISERSVLVTTECVQLAAKVAVPGLASAIIPPTPCQET